MHNDKPSITKHPYITVNLHRESNMHVTIKVNMDNAAFSDDPTAELARILRALADRLTGASWDESYPLRDINGNKVGSAEFQA